MADSNNPGQFGNRKDTQQQASAGGQASNSSGSTSDTNSGNFANNPKKASEAGKHSHGGNNS